MIGSNTVPLERTQRLTVKAFFQDIFDLREKGYSFTQIAGLLSETGAITPDPSALEKYYYEIFECRQDARERRYSGRMQILIEYEKALKSKPISTTIEAARLAKLNRYQRKAEQDIKVILDIDDLVGDENMDTVVDLRCGSVEPWMKEANCAKVSPDVYNKPEGHLEHPAIPGLMLSLPQRLCNAELEIFADNVFLRLETDHERIFRIQWKKPIPRTESSTDGNFVEMNLKAFQ